VGCSGGTDERETSTPGDVDGRQFVERHTRDDWLSVVGEFDLRDRVEQCTHDVAGSVTRAQ
jgi:hypothetical protein